LGEEKHGKRSPDHEKGRVKPHRLVAYGKDPAARNYGREEKNEENIRANKAKLRKKGLEN